MIRRFTTAFLLCGLVLPLRAQRIRFVDASASGAGDGSSWTDAFPALQDALAAAEAGDEIWVARGVYHPDQGQGITPGDRLASFVLKDGVALYGGFAGTESTREERDFEANETVLSGDLLGNDNDNIDLEEPTRSDNSYHVVMAGEGIDASTVLDGFTITGGNANEVAPHNGGGGMSNAGGSPRVVNMIFMANTAGSGGGMSNNGSKTRIEHVIFIRNASSGFGGGLHNFRSSPFLTDVTFIDNTTEGFGGGMYNDRGNSVVTHTEFINNTSSSLGGGMYNRKDSTLIVNVAFIGNKATVFDGGGLYNDESTVVVTNVIFSGNTAAQDGAGMYNEISSPTLTNVTFSENQASADGGAIFNFSSDPHVVNTIFWGNRATNQRGQFFSDALSTIFLAHSIIEDGLPNDAIDGGGNLDLDPLFVDADGTDDIPGTEDDDLRLMPSSPAIDAGDNAALPPDSLDLDEDGNLTEPLPIDLDGHVRLFDGGSGMATVDMGAFEFGAPVVHIAVEPMPNVLPGESILSAVYPNPFQVQATLHFKLSKRMPVTVKLYDMLGRGIAVLYDGVARGGETHTLRIDGSQLSSGVYIIRLLGNGIRASQAVLIVR